MSPATGNYHLMSTSPAIDSGQNSVLETFKSMTGMAWTTDFEGNPRVQDATGKGCIIDMGAYEYPGTASNCGVAESLSSSLNPAMVGQNVTFTAQLSATSGIPTGDIQFLDGTNLLSTQTVSGTGSASFTTNTLTVGSHTIVANYQPTGTFGSSTASLIEVIDGDTTGTALNMPAQPDRHLKHRTVHCDRDVRERNAHGVDLFFTDNGALLATQGLVGGTTNVTYTGTVAGTHNIIAAYTPTASFAASSARPVRKS